MYLELKILIAEDDKDIALSYKVVLEDRGHVVMITYDGQDCLCKYHEELQKIAIGIDMPVRIQPFDLVILDYRMPKINGIQVAKEILAVNPHQRIIVASAHYDHTSIDRVNSLKQIVEVSKKPFTNEFLVQTVEEYKLIYDELEKLNVDVDIIRAAGVSYEQLSSILGTLRNCKR
jgi:CheY-like chemotaxis protein